MNHIATLERNATDAAPTQRVSARAKDDATMLKAAANLTRDLNVPDARIYWADMLGSALLGYAALFAAMLAGIAASARRSWLARLGNLRCIGPSVTG